MRKKEKRKTPCGQKTRMIKQRETHVIFALDLLDKCIIAIETKQADPESLKEMIENARKEVGKI